MTVSNIINSVDIAENKISIKKILLHTTFSTLRIVKAYGIYEYIHFSYFSVIFSTLKINNSCSMLTRKNMRISIVSK